MTQSFVQVEPKGLKFPFVRNKHPKCWLTLTNMSNHNIAFKFKTTHPKKHMFCPTMGAISPGSCYVVEDVSLLHRVLTKPAKPAAGLLKEKCLIQAIVAKDGLSFSEVTSEMFREAASCDVQEHKLKVYLLCSNALAAPNQSSPQSQKTELPSDNLFNCWRSLFINLAIVVNDCQRKLFISIRVKNENEEERISEAQSSEPEEKHAGIMRDDHTEDLEMGIDYQNTKSEIIMPSKLEEEARSKLNRIIILAILLGFMIGCLVAMLFG